MTAYGWLAVDKDLRLVGRYDLVNMNADADDAHSELVIIGVDWTPLKDIHVMPNFYYRGFRGAAPDLLYARVTLHYDF
jgi:hypothetical protein